MSPTITAFEASPDRGRGFARDLQVRWALEEVGMPYDVRLLSFKAMKEPAHLGVHPFGQIPTFEDGDLKLFESGAILLHIAEASGQLLPTDRDARLRAIMWMFAAVDTLKAPIVEREQAILFDSDKPWLSERMPVLDERVRTRLAQLSRHLGEREWIDGFFSIGDIMIINLLRRPAGFAFVAEYPNIARYVERGTARPAFSRAFDAQFAVFQQSQGR
jgi:glutathione S-transferase